MGVRSIQCMYSVVSSSMLRTAICAIRRAGKYLAKEGTGGCVLVPSNMSFYAPWLCC